MEDDFPSKQPKFAPGKYQKGAKKLEYPCWVTYALMGKKEADLLQAIKQVLGRSRYRVKSFPQYKGEYSIHAEVWVTSEYQRTEFFHNFQMHRAVRMVV